MDNAPRFLEGLNSNHQRVGYLAVLAAVASRAGSTKKELVASLRDRLFEPIASDDARYHPLLERVPAARRSRLLDRTEPIDAPAPEIRGSRPAAASKTLALADCWLQDRRMPSTTGLVAASQLGAIIDLGRWTGILTEDLELSDLGLVLRWLLESGDDPATRNWIYPRHRPSLPRLYLWLLLRADALIPALAVEWTEREDAGRQVALAGEHGLLRAAARRLLTHTGSPTDPSDLLATLPISEYLDALRTDSKLEETATRARLEMLVDLALARRRSEDEPDLSGFDWTPTDLLRALSGRWSQLSLTRPGISAHLDEGFFSSLSAAQGTGATRALELEERLLWFVRAYGALERPVGFTPGRGVSLLACLLASEAHRTIDISEVFDAVYAAADSEWTRFLDFSGGSRFDREFLIQVDPSLLELLEERVASRTSSS